MEIFSLVGSILLKDNDVKVKLKDIDNTAKKTGSSFDAVFDKMGSTAVKIGGQVGTALDNLDKKFQLWMAENKKTASSSEVSAKALETYKGKMQALSEEIEKGQKSLKGIADEFGKDSTEYKTAENNVMDLELKYKSLENESKKLQQATNSINFRKIADGAISVGSALTTKVTTPIIGAFGLAAKSASSFEHQMADIRKEVASTGAPVSQVNSLMKEMSQNSIKWSEDFGVSTTTINQGLLTLVKDGYSGSEAMKIMQISLYAARGANEDLGTVIDGVGSSLEAYGLKTNNASQTVKNATKLTDAYAYVSNQTKASMSSLSEAASIMGSTFAALKIPMTQGAAAVGELQSNGIDASTAANSLKAGLVNLVHPSAQMSAAMKEMNLQVFDSKGQMKDLPTILDSIQKGTKGWTDQQKQAAIATIFGKESLSSWNVLLNKGGDHLKELSQGAENATGSVKKLSDAMKNTPENKFKEFKESVHALGVAFGQDVLPSLMPLVNVATNLIKRFSNLDEGTKKFVVTVLALVAGLGPVILVFGKTLDTIIKLHNNIGLLQQGFTKLGGMSGILSGALKALPFMAIVAGIVAVIAIGRELYKHWDQIKAKAGELKTVITTHFNNIKTIIINVWNNVKATTLSVWNGIKTSILGVWNGLKTSATTVFNGIKTVIVTIWNGIKTAIMAVITPIVSGVINLFNSMKTGISNIFNGFKTFFTGIWQAIKSIFLGAVLLIIDLVTGNFTQMSKDTQLIWNDLKTAFSNIWNGIKEIFTGALQAIAGLMHVVWGNIVVITTTAWNGIKSFLSGLWSGLTSIASSAWNGMKSVIFSIVTETATVIQNIWNGILNFFRNLPGTLANLGSAMFTAMKNGISSVLSTLSGVVKNGFNSSISFLKTLPSKALQWGKDFIQGFINGIKAMFGKVGDAVTSVGDKIRKLLHFSIPDEGPLADADTWMPDMLQMMADGIINNTGIVTDALEKLTKKMKSKMRVNPPTTQTKTATTTTPTAQSGVGRTASALPKTMDKYGQDADKSLGEGFEKAQNQSINPAKKVINTIAKNIGDFADNTKSYGQDANKNLGSGITDSSSVVTNAINILIAALQNLLNSFSANSTKYGQGTNTSIAGGIDSTQGNVTSAVTGVTTAASNLLNNFATGSVQYGQSANTSIANGITSTQGNVTSAVAGVTTAAGNLLNTFATNAISYGTQTDNSLANGITNTASVVISAVNSLITNIGNLFKNFAQSCTAYGKSIVDSLSAGVQASENNLVDVVNELVQKVIEAFRNGFDVHSPSRVLYKIGVELPMGLMKGIKALDLKGFIENWLSSITGSMNGKVGEWLAAALAITGQPMAALPALEIIAQHESGGNPLAINLRDSNAAAGHPSEGLMQTIGPTFERWKLPGMDNIWNPIDNAVAAIRYMIGEYGSIWNVPGVRSIMSGGGYLPYASGTDDATPGVHTVGENGFEIVLNKTMGLFRGGETVLNNSDSIKFLSNIASLGSNAVAWGANIIQGIASGVKSKLGILTGTASDAANTVGSETALDFMQSLADELGKNTDKPEDAAAKVASLVSQRIESIKAEASIAISNLYEQLAELGKQEITTLNSTPEAKRSAMIQEYNDKRDAINKEIALRKSQADSEIAEIQRIGKMNKDELAQEIQDQKDFTASVNDLNSKIIDALKEKYSEEEKAQEDSLNTQMSNLDDWKDQAEKAIDDVADKKTAAIQAEMDALDEQQKMEEREEDNQKDLDSIEKLKSSIAYEHDDYNRAELQKQLDQATADYNKKLQDQAVEDKKTDLQKQMDAIKADADAQKQSIENIYNDQKKYLQKQLDDLKTFYEKKTTDAELNAEAEQMIMQNNQEAIVALLNSYGDQYKQAGQTLGDRLVEGFQPAIDKIKDMIASITAEIGSARDDSLDAMTETSAAISSVSAKTLMTTSSAPVNNSKVINNNVNITSPVAQTPSQQRSTMESTLQKLSYQMS